jgi:hypothetical protein
VCIIVLQRHVPGSNPCPGSTSASGIALPIPRACARASSWTAKSMAQAQSALSPVAPVQKVRLFLHITNAKQPAKPYPPLLPLYSIIPGGKGCNDDHNFVSDGGSRCSDYSASSCDCSFVHCGFADADSACAIECETCDPGL